MDLNNARGITKQFAINTGFRESIIQMQKITSFARARGERSLYLKVSVGGIRRLEVPNRIFSEGECGRCTHGVSRCTCGTHTKCDLTGNGFSFS